MNMEEDLCWHELRPAGGRCAMLMTAFRLRNYKNIEDTGWVECDALACVVGKNEAGKTALFRGLSKLNPTDCTPYDPLKEFPRARFSGTDFEREDPPAASARFAFTADESQALRAILPFLEDVEAAECTRRYSGALDVRFHPVPEVNPVLRSTWLECLSEVRQQLERTTAPNGKGDEWGQVRAQLLDVLEQTVDSQPGEADVSLTPDEMTPVLSRMRSHLTEDWHSTLVEMEMEPLEAAVADAEQFTVLDEARQWVRDNMPRFLYFAEYEVLDSALHLPSFVHERNSEAPKARISGCMFDHVGLDAKELLQLGRDESDEQEEARRRRRDHRQVLLDSASQLMTKRFSEWWQQSKHTFKYNVDGDFFRVWVSDQDNPSLIELDQRSRGMQYFFSFYLVFLVEADAGHEGCILLLDEPGLHLHPTAQMDLVSFLNELSTRNQTLYSTHSPFLVDSLRLDRVRAMYSSEDGEAHLSTDVWPRDRETLFPLQAALGYNVCQSLFLAPRQVLVEGITDFMLLQAGDHLLKTRGEAGLPDDVALVPAGGARNFGMLASVLIGNEIDIVVVMDSDDASGGSQTEAAQKKLSELIDVSTRCLLIGDILERPVAELEDLIPEDYYIQAVEDVYGGSIALTKQDRKHPTLVKKITSYFATNRKDTFEKWRPITSLVRMMAESPESAPQEFVDNMQALFDRTRSAFAVS